MNDLTDLYQFNHLIKNRDKSNEELLKIVEEARRQVDVFDSELQIVRKRNNNYKTISIDAENILRKSNYTTNTYD